MLFLAGLTSIERLIAKVTAATSARVIVGLAIAFTYLFPSTLVFLATDGDVDTFKLALFFPNQQFRWTDVLGGLLLGAVPLLLIVIPEVLRRNSEAINTSALPKGMKSEDLRYMVTKGLAAVGALASGLYVLALHFYGGPLAQISVKQLVFAMLAVAIILSPLYKSVASICWARGIANSFDPSYWLRRPWMVSKEMGRIFFAKPLRNQEEDHCNTPIPEPSDGSNT